ncbi:3TM-type holin [Caulobacter sp. BK020]|uniref:3TM-type holin n=1 Tax=Caulobacter sp. BK020 TaxID=2512117 RepID=UPI001049E740|nr:3TM-type holin [Caulobacter sp. BK020]TCS14533.1 holin (3TMs family) [Caulobacter sp. BK020]
MAGLTDLLGIGLGVLDRVLPDPQAKAAAQLELMKLVQAGDLAALAAETDLAKGQVQVNAVEAASPSLWTSGWRPFIGWVCGAALAYTYLLRPILNPWVTKWTGVPMEALDMVELMSLLAGMLGLGGLRTVEKLNGKA